MQPRKPMYRFEKESFVTETTGAITAASTTINLLDATVLPNPPNRATLYNREQSAKETVHYAGRTATSITGVTRGDANTIPQIWPVGTDVTRAISNADLDNFGENIGKLYDVVENLPDFITDGNGDKFLSDDGTYHEVIGTGGTTDHAALTNLAFADSGHTGFASLAQHNYLVNRVDNLVVSGGGTDDHAQLTNLAYIDSGHTGFASGEDLNDLEQRIEDIEELLTLEVWD